MGKLEHCPHEVEYLGENGFKKIDMNNLAYMIKFPFGHDYNELNSGILAGYLDDLVVIGEDERLKRYYGDRSVHYMLPEGLKIGRPNGMERLLKIIESANEEVITRRKSNIFEDIEDSDKLLSCKKQEDGTYMIGYAEYSGTNTVPIAVLVPCCPSCHHPLPLRWEKADAFVAISLQSLTGTGKSTFLTSMMVNDWECLNIPDSDFFVTSAQDGKVDDIYMNRYKDSENLYEKGICPRNTPTGYIIAPVFLSVLYKKKYLMIVGIYDNSGEVLGAMESHDPRISVLPNMDAHIYLIEPKQMNIHFPKKDGEKRTGKKQYPLLSIAEQAEYQKEHGKEMISGRELLQQAFGAAVPRGRRANPMRMYESLKKAMLLSGQYEKLSKQHLSCVVVKADLLETLPEFQNNPYKEILFQREDSTWNRDVMFIQQEMIKENIFQKYVFTNERQMQVLENDMGSVSWHCISALGCEPKETGQNEYTFDPNDYAPIRLADPVMTCLVQKIEELGWTD